MTSREPKGKLELLPLGSTGLQVSCFGLGLAALGRPGYINLGHAQDLKGDFDPSSMEGRAHKVLDAAWKSGLQYFDTARSYGRGEEFLSDWLISRQIPLNALTVGSKWGYTYTADWKVQAQEHEVKDHSLPVLRRQWAESYGNLGKHLGLYQIHSATLESGVLENIEVLNELVRIKSLGVHIGLSISGPNQSETLQRAMELRIDGVPVFETVQATWNLFESSAGPVLQEAHDAGMGVIIKEALANGRLSDRNRLPADADDLKLLSGMALDAGASIDSFVLAVTLKQPFVDVVLSGASTTSQLASNLKAVDLQLELGSELTGLTRPADLYWNQRKKMEWN